MDGNVSDKVWSVWSVANILLRYEIPDGPRFERLLPPLLRLKARFFQSRVRWCLRTSGKTAVSAIENDLKIIWTREADLFKLTPRGLEKKYFAGSSSQR